MNERQGARAPTRSDRLDGAWRWLVAVAFLGASLLPMTGVGATEEPGGANASDGDAPASADSADIAPNVAPAWPFFGIVGKQYNSTLNITSLVYWNSETGARSAVRLFPDLSGESWAFGCPGELSAGRHGVRYTHYEAYPGYVEIVVPWGDDAYPILESERFIDFHASAEDQRASDNGAGHLDIEMHYSVLRVDNSEAVGYYVLQYDPEAQEQGLVQIDSRDGEATYETEADEDERIWGSIGRPIGSAGFYYGFEVQHSEPACVEADTYLVDGRTGDLVQCSTYFGGRPLLIYGVPSAKASELPKPYSSAPCDGFDLGRLDPSGATEGLSD